MARARETRPWMPGRIVILDELNLPNPYTNQLYKSKDLFQAARLGTLFMACCRDTDSKILKLMGA